MEDAFDTFGAGVNTIVNVGIASVVLDSVRRMNKPYKKQKWPKRIL